MCLQVVSNDPPVSNSQCWDYRYTPIWPGFIFLETGILYLVQSDLKLSCFTPFSAEMIGPRELTWLKTILIKSKESYFIDLVAPTF